jgi:hypothetical protein
MEETGHEDGTGIVLPRREMMWWADWRAMTEKPMVCEYPSVRKVPGIADRTLVRFTRTIPFKRFSCLPPPGPDGFQEEVWFEVANIADV